MVPQPPASITTSTQLVYVATVNVFHDNQKISMVVRHSGHNPQFSTLAKVSLTARVDKGEYGSVWGPAGGPPLP